MIKDIGLAMGFRQFEQLDPSNYADSESIALLMTIDVWSGQLIKIQYKDSTRSETYGSYGARSLIVAPKDSIPIYELQSRLQQIR